MAVLSEEELIYKLGVIFLVYVQKERRKTNELQSKPSVSPRSL